VFEGAETLLKRSLKGDASVDAAIDNYASERDVGEFLKTLQRLANTTVSSMETISSAKRELLQHSLDMLIKQGQVSKKGKPC
jgi:hypothetical protein